MQKILITGASGFIGSALAAALYETGLYSLVLAYNTRKPAALPGAAAEMLDITDKTKLAYILELHRPDAVINTAALSKPDYCEQNPAHCWAANAEAAAEIAAICRKIDAYLLHFSTDLVFSGAEAAYTEEAETLPLSEYGRSKAQSELLLAQSGCKHSIVRTSQVYGSDARGIPSGFIGWVVQSAQSRQKINIADDQFRCPTYLPDLVNACIKLIGAKKEGIYHLSGNECRSVYSYAMEICSTWGLSAASVQPVLTAQLNEPAKRPLRTNLDTGKAYIMLGYTPRSLRDGLKAVLQAEKNSNLTLAAK
jgi:dTDP-4-dehydrorhamnose reductase